MNKYRKGLNMKSNSLFFFNGIFALTCSPIIAFAFFYFEAVIFYFENIIEKTIEEIVEGLIKEEYNLIKTKMNGENLYTFAEENVQKKKEKIAIFFGNEANGISDYLKENISKSISIPMEKDTESLNLGVSFSIIIYELYRANLM